MTADSTQPAPRHASTGRALHAIAMEPEAELTRRLRVRVDGLGADLPLPAPQEFRVLRDGGARAAIFVTAVERTRDAEGELVLIARGQTERDFAAGFLVVHGQGPGARFGDAAGRIDEIDPAPAPAGPAVERLTRPIDYMAKDYASFRQSMLDSMSLDIPEWRERDPADLAVALVEALAYAADLLSYHQDAVATEAYLGTARQRLSLARHARLLDYAIDEGCSARVPVVVEVTGDDVPLPAGTPFLAGATDPDGRLDTVTYRRLLDAGYPGTIYESATDRTLHQSLNRIALEGAPAAGAVSATLRGAHPELGRGDLLILVGVSRAEADPAVTHPVRLNADPVIEARDDGRTAVTAVRWHPDDALPAALVAGGRDLHWHVAGNVVVAVEGRSGLQVPLGEVPADGAGRLRFRGGRVARLPPADEGVPRDRIASAREHLASRAGAIAAVTLSGSDGSIWTSRADLIRSGPYSRDVVFEPAPGGGSQIRFGDGTFGRRPDPGVRYVARYRSGSGPAGRIAAGAIGQVVSDDARIARVSNPVASSGGSDGEDTVRIRMNAPAQLTRQARCITPDDFVDALCARPDVLDAVARRRWSGSWQTMVVWVHPTGAARREDAAFLAGLADWLQPRRPIGLPLDLRPPRDVPLDIALAVRVRPGASARAVERDLLAMFSNGTGPGGAPGYFDRDTLRFGDRIYQSDVVARAAAAPGVKRVEPTRFRRMDDTRPGATALATAIMLEFNELARVDNDARHPERGRIVFSLAGGGP